MYVLRGSHLRLSLTNSLRIFNSHKSLLFILLAGVLTTIAFSTRFDWMGRAARRSQADIFNSVSASFKKLPAPGPVLPKEALPNEAANKYSSFLTPLQGCTVNCTATVPATGQKD